MPDHVPLEKRVAVSIEDAAALLSISRSLAYQMAADGRLPTFKIGSLIRVRVADLAKVGNNG